MTRREPSGVTTGSAIDLTWAAHELKSPTALVRQLALELRADTADPQRQALLDQIILTSERSLRLTTSLSKTARLDDATLELEPVNPQHLCEEVAHELTPLYRAHGRELRVRSRRRAPLVIANRELLRRVLLGFGDNALHYSHDAVLLGIERRGNHAQVNVRDQGPLTPRTAAHVVTGRPDASGLGLMIAAKFAAAMQGTIGTHRHQSGMTFYIRMPVSEQLVLL